MGLRGVSRLGLFLGVCILIDLSELGSGKRRNVCILAHAHEVIAGSESFSLVESVVNWTVVEENILLKFKRGITFDPLRAFANWDPNLTPLCNWTGVLCDAQHGRITNLTVSEKQLEGTIAPELGGLQFLAILDLQSNNFSGEIPPELGNCSRLQEIYLRVNLLGGELPASLGALTHLTLIDAGENYLTSELPAALMNCSRMRFVDISENYFFGSVPQDIGNKWQRLEYIFLSFNNFVGPFPSSFANCSRLVVIQTVNNNFTGQISPEFAKLPNLEQFDPAGNLITGEFPSFLTNCTKLTQLMVSDTQISGKLPEDIGKLTNLVYFYIYTMDLSGHLPASIGNLTSLQEFDAAENPGLGGTLPSELGQLPTIQFLSLRNCNFSGPIPKSLGNLTTVSYFEFSNNFFSGELPPELSTMRSILTFKLRNNLFEGRIPDSFGDLSNLTEISFQGNRLSGGIPSSFGNLSNLQSLNLTSNLLSGPIPNDLWKCLKLSRLSLGSNMLTGFLPHFLGNMTFLSLVSLRENTFTGTIPVSLASNPTLIDLDLSSNQLTGPVPFQLGKTSLQLGLNLSRNLLSGSIPSDLGDLTSLQVLDLSWNNLSGKIPNSLSGCYGLVSLDLSNNHLNGSIPSSLAELKYLQSVNFSVNNLEGPVPRSGIFTNLTDASFLSNPELCGPIVTKPCLAAASAPLESSSDSSTRKTIHCKGFKCKWTWILVGCGLLVLLLGLASFMCVKYSRIRKRRVAALKTVCLSHDKKVLPAHVKVVAESIGENEIIGTGSYSIVYKATLPGDLPIAVKVLNFPTTGKGKTDVANVQAHRHSILHELETLGKCRHRNLLRIIGAYANTDMEALIVEFMPNGNLDKHLHEYDSSNLNWPSRFNIAIGVANAMAYLHHECHEPIIHCDLKPSNILLDADLEAKVCDFGISKFATQPGEGDASASILRGTTGYIAPEYGSSVRVTMKGDVYSYGVILLEILTGKRPTSVFVAGLGNSFAEWVASAFPDRGMDVLDKKLAEDSESPRNMEQMLLVCRVGLLCTQLSPQDRPSMRDVANMLTVIRDMKTTM